ELDESIFTDVFKLITKNRVFRGLEAHQRRLGGQLDEIMEDLQATDQKQTVMSKVLEAARDAVRHC
ncbi:hypothetical protein A2U01_0088578, partial [Trifolium medium]|nr:hypothetical protein [Trifolium medium]